MRTILTGVAAAAAIIIAVSPAAASDPADCALLAPVVAKAADAIGAVARTTAGGDEDGAIARLSGTERTALERARDARLKLVPELDAYADALAEAAGAMRACSGQ